MLWDGSGRVGRVQITQMEKMWIFFEKKTCSDLVVFFLTGFGNVNGLVTIRFVSSLNECKLNYHVIFYKFVHDLIYYILFIS